MKAYEFNAEKVRDRLVELIRRTAKEQGFTRAVLGISGGKDSAVAAALCARALGRQNVYGVMMPDGEQSDIRDGEEVCEALGIRRRTVNIGAVHDLLKEVTDQNGITAERGEFPVPFSRKSDINVAPRLRMTVLRYIAQAIGARVAGTDNLSEMTVGYCTKDGDTSCDFSVLGALTSVEVVEIGLTMEELPQKLVEKTPADGVSGAGDEDNLGLKYRDIHLYIREGTCGKAKTDERIRRKEAAGLHKRQMPLILNPLDAD